MSRISLKETYDNRSVIAQIAKVTDTAEDAAETVQQKAAEINDAITEVNAAVTTANAASASAQQSAQTVAGYENRLATAENDIDGLESDLNAVTLRVTTAEGQIVTIQGRVTALETADGQNVKLTGEHAIGDYAVLLTGNQTVYGDKRIMGRILERVSYVKNTVGATVPIPIFRISDITRDNRYMKTSLFISGRTTPTTITEIVWNETTLTKTDIVGTQTNPFSIMSDAEGHYWLCVSIVANNTINVFVLDCLRNAGYDEPIYPLITGETPDMTGWSTVVSQ